VEVAIASPWMVRFTIHGLAIATSTHYEDMKKGIPERGAVKGQFNLEKYIA